MAHCVSIIVVAVDIAILLHGRVHVVIIAFVPAGSRYETETARSSDDSPDAESCENSSSAKPLELKTAVHESILARSRSMGGRRVSEAFGDEATACSTIGISNAWHAFKYVTEVTVMTSLAMALLSLPFLFVMSCHLSSSPPPEGPHGDLVQNTTTEPVPRQGPAQRRAPSHQDLDPLTSSGCHFEPYENQCSPDGFCLLEGSGAESPHSDVDCGCSQLYGVFALGPRDVFIMGVYRLIHFDGTCFRILTTDVDPEAISDFWSASATENGELFVVGGRGLVASFDGSRWTDHTSALGASTTHTDLWSSPHGHVYVVGEQQTIFHHDGTTWELQHSLPPPTEADEGEERPRNDLWGVWGVEADGSLDIYAVGSGGAILHSDGGRWTAIESGTGETLSDVWGSGPSDIFVVGARGTVLHFNGRRWASVDIGVQTSLSGVWGLAPNDIYVVGDLGTILHFDGHQWSPLNSGVRADLYDVWASVEAGLWIVGDDTVLHRSESVRAP